MKDAHAPEEKAYTGKSCHANGVVRGRLEGHDRIINHGGKIPPRESYLYAYGKDQNTSLESVGMAYRSHCNEEVEYISQIVEGINTIMFNMIEFKVPGRTNITRYNCSAVECLIHNIRHATERILADNVKLPSLKGMSLNRSFPFAESIDFIRPIPQMDNQGCSITGCSGRAEYFRNPLNPLQGIVCSEHKPGEIPLECGHCGLPSDPLITDTPFRVSQKDRKRRCITCIGNPTRHWYLWDTAEATARLLFPEFREYHLARLRAMQPNERLPNEQICSLCLHVCTLQCGWKSMAQCANCIQHPPSCNSTELREWSLTQFQPEGGRDKWFREKAIHVREGIGFIPYSGNRGSKPSAAFMSGVSKVPCPMETFWNENVTFIKERGIRKHGRRLWFPAICQKLLDLKAQGHTWVSIAQDIQHTSRIACRRMHAKLTTNETWNTSSDNHLLKLVDFFGPQWEEIERHVFRQSADECARRYEVLKNSTSDENQDEALRSPSRKTELVINIHFEIDTSNKSFRIVSSDYHTKDCMN